MNNIYSQQAISVKAMKIQTNYNIVDEKDEIIGYVKEKVSFASIFGKKDYRVTDKDGNVLGGFTNKGDVYGADCKPLCKWSFSQGAFVLSDNNGQVFAKVYEERVTDAEDQVLGNIVKTERSIVKSDYYYTIAKPLDDEDKQTAIVSVAISQQMMRVYVG